MGSRWSLRWWELTNTLCMGRPLHNGVADSFIVTGLDAPPARRPGVRRLKMVLDGVGPFWGRHFG